MATRRPRTQQTTTTTIRSATALLKEYNNACQRGKVLPLSTVTRYIETLRDNHGSLQRLLLPNSKIADKDLEPLLEVLCKLPELTDVSLNNGSLTDPSVRLLADAVCRGQMQSLTSLELFGHELTDGCCSAFARMLSSRHCGLNRLKVGDNGITAHGMRDLCEGLRQSTSLRQLHIGGNPVGDAGMGLLHNALASGSPVCGLLDSLSLRSCGISCQGCVPLALLLLSDRCQLSELQLKKNEIGSDGACSLGQALSVNNTLTMLDLQNNSIGPEGAAGMARGLQQNEALAVLNLNDNQIGAGGMLAIAEALPYATSLCTIGVANNNIPSTAIARFFRVLAEGSSSSLIAVDVASNTLDLEAARSIANMLEHPICQLQSLNLHMCQIPAAGTCCIANALRVNHTLEALDYGGNSSSGQAHRWAAVMAENHSLRKLCLSDNELRDTETCVIVSALYKNNRVLHVLSMGGQSASANAMSQKTKRTLKDALRRNTINTPDKVPEKSSRVDIREQINQAREYATHTEHAPSTIAGMEDVMFPVVPPTPLPFPDVPCLPRPAGWSGGVKAEYNMPTTPSHSHSPPATATPVSQPSPSLASMSPQASWQARRWQAAATPYTATFSPVPETATRDVLPVHPLIDGQNSVLEQTVVGRWIQSQTANCQSSALAQSTSSSMGTPCRLMEDWFTSLESIEADALDQQLLVTPSEATMTLQSESLVSQPHTLSCHSRPSSWASGLLPAGPRPESSEGSFFDSKLWNLPATWAPGVCDDCAWDKFLY